MRLTVVCKYYTNAKCTLYQQILSNVDGLAYLIYNSITVFIYNSITVFHHYIHNFRAIGVPCESEVRATPKSFSIKRTFKCGDCPWKQ